MVQITQTDDEIKIVIELNRLITSKPDITLLPTYLKFNTPPIFFDRHLAQEIDDMASYCRIFKNEARINLIKKQQGIWPELFMTLSKEELFKRRLEISDQIVERNKERDKKTLERYEHMKRSEIDKEVRRESSMRKRVKQFQESACREALMVGGKETHTKQLGKIELQAQTANGNSCNRLGTPAARPNVKAAVPNGGKINVNFSKFSLHTHKRESQQGAKMPFTIVDNCQTAEQNRCKISQDKLEKYLQGTGIQTPIDRENEQKNGLDKHDYDFIGSGMDCAVIPLSRHKQLALVQTVDFFYPLVDNPRTMGEIALANVVSDVYAVGVTYIDKLNMIISAPTELSEHERDIVVPLIIEGFRNAAKLANCRVSVRSIVVNPWYMIGGIASAVCTKEDIIM